MRIGLLLVALTVATVVLVSVGISPAMAVLAVTISAAIFALMLLAAGIMLDRSWRRSLRLFVAGLAEGLAPLREIWRRLS